MSDATTAPPLPSMPPLHALPLAHLLNPRALAIVGASADPRSFGGFVLGNLQRFGFDGALHLVSRSSTEIAGLPCVAAVSDLPMDLDVAVLAIPEAGVLDAVRDLAHRRCKTAVLFASGYAEAGSEGQRKQQALADVAQQLGIQVLGPNCMGYTHWAHGVPLTFEPLAARPREARPGVAVIAQSGFMAANVRDALLARDVPVTAVFSTGNEVSIGVEDLIAALLDDPQTRVITLYAEQIRRPALFVQLAEQARRAGKPLVLLMPGRSARARDAAQSHTGALAGDHATISTALRRQAVALVATLDELLDVTAIVLRYPVPPSGGVGFMTGSGAMKNLALDLADDLGLALPPLSERTTAALRAALPEYAVAENPLDYTTVSVRNPGLVGELVLTMLADEALSGLVLAIPVGPVVAQKDKAEHIVPTLARADKPTVLVLTGDSSPIEPFFAQAITDSGVPLFRSADRALRALQRVAQMGEALQRAQRSETQQLVLASDDGALGGVAIPGKAGSNGIYAEHHGKAWLKALGVPVPRGELVRTLDQAQAAATRLGYPVVLKAQSAALPHKSDVGGVIVGVADDAALRQGWQRLFANLQQNRPDLLVGWDAQTRAVDADPGAQTTLFDGVLVEAMGRRGLELVVGARRDPAWGPVVLVGLGGIWIEALHDVRLLPADLAVSDILVELNRLKAAAVLHGLRGEPAVDLQAIAEVVSRIGAQMLAHPQIAEIDINPLIAYPAPQQAQAQAHAKAAPGCLADSVLALDALVVLDAQATAVRNLSHPTGDA